MYIRINLRIEKNIPVNLNNIKFIEDLFLQ